MCQQCVEDVIGKSIEITINQDRDVVVSFDGDFVDEGEKLRSVITLLEVGTATVMAQLFEHFTVEEVGDIAAVWCRSVGAHLDKYVDLKGLG